MDCNKDEATKAKEIAEKKLGEKDFKGARKFALKAQCLYSGLDGLKQLLMILNIYTSSEKKVNGVVDWYGVLGVDPSSDDEALKKQYRKLALTLHPDKNKSIGAEGAFKLVSEAWSLLSDKIKRITFDQKRTGFDQKRSFSGIYEKVIPPPSKPTGRNSLHPSVNNFNSSKNSPNPHLVHSKRKDTFWTVCTNCKMHFEYALHYLNKKLQCFECKEPFLAIPTPPPQNSQAPVPGYVEHGTSSHLSGYAGSVPSYSSAANLSVAQLLHGNLKRVNENAHMSATLDGAIKTRPNGKRANGGNPRKRSRLHELKMNESGKVNSDQISMGSRSFGVGTVSGSHSTAQTAIFGTNAVASTRELSLLETRNMLIDKARKDICKKLNEWKNLKSKQNASNKAANFRKKDKSKVNGTQTVKDNPVSNSEVKYPDEELNTSSAMGSSVSEGQAPDLAMIVPDSDFHDFDKDRTENSFGDNQVWAAYDDDDGMPRYYAMIHNVLSRKPFKMRISWLNSKSTAEFGNLNWVGCGFYKTSGDFRVGKHELNKTVNSFSQRVKWVKGARGAICIYPSKGDVWALYRNWSTDWSEHTPDETIHQYDMVEVLTDYNEEKGLTVIPLVKVAGFKTVFRQHIDQNQVRVIPREEMFRFSHQVPSFLLTGNESPKAPKGCLELDPAAIPIELLQVSVQTSENVAKGNVEEVEVKKNQVKEPIRTEIASEVRIMENGIRAHLGTATVG